MLEATAKHLRRSCCRQAPLHKHPTSLTALSSLLSQWILLTQGLGDFAIPSAWFEQYTKLLLDGMEWMLVGTANVHWYNRDSGSLCTREEVAYQAHWLRWA